MKRWLLLTSAVVLIRFCYILLGNACPFLLEIFIPEKQLLFCTRTYMRNGSWAPESSLKLLCQKTEPPHSSSRLISLLSDGWHCNLRISNYMWWMFPVSHLIFFIGVHSSLFTTPHSFSAAVCFFLRWLIGAFPSLESRVEIPGNCICSDVRNYLQLQLGIYYFCSP